MQAQLWTISGLAVELDKDRRTLAKDLEGLEPDAVDTADNGRQSRKYRMSRVFAHLANGGIESPKDRLTRLQADKTEIELGALRGSLIDRNVAKRHWESMVLAMRSLMMALPTKAAIHVAGDPSRVAKVQDALTDLVHEALEEIAGDAIAADVRRRFDIATQGSETAAEADDQRVGGSIPPTERGSERGNRKMADEPR